MNDHPRTDPDFEARIREALNRSVVDVHADGRLDALVDDRRRSLARHRSRTWLSAAAAILVAVSVVAAVAYSRLDSDTPDRVATEPGTPTPSSTTTKPPRAEQTPVVIDGMAESALGYRHNGMAAWVWTGEELLVWGSAGSTAPGSDNRSGAAYDPATDVWREMAPSPLVAVDHRAVWTGTVMVVGPAPTPDPAGAETYHYATYDPAADAWEVVGGSVDANGGRPVAWTGSEVLLLAGDYGTVTLTALNLDTGSQRDVPPPKAAAPVLNGRPVGGTVFIPIDGGRVAAISNYQSRVPVLSIADADLTGWEQVSLDAAPGGVDLTMVWTGDELVTPAPGGAAYSPATGTWRRLADYPAEVTEPYGPWVSGPAVAAGRLLVGPAGVYDLAADEWTHTDLEVPDRRGDPVLAWTGTQVLVWSGSRSCTYVDGVCVTPEEELFPSDGLRLRLEPED